ncbi:MAG: DedA family protein [Alphaproteobacteria bacterium]|nr:DedA family protein [Alphaproteobacteria bacterium]
MTKKIYQWMVDAASGRNAMWALAVVAFIESSFFPIPPDIMLIPMIVATPKRAWKIALVATIASVIGGYFGYLIGFLGYDLIAKPLLNFYGYLEKFEQFSRYYNEYGAWIVLGAGITPFPYKVITIASGVVGMNIWVFGIASVVARGLRFFIIAALLRFFGEPIKKIIEKHFGLLSIIFFILLIGGFLLIKYL